MENSVFATQDTEFHKILRSRLSNIYAMSSILAMEPYIEGVASRSFRKLHEWAKRGEVVDLSKQASYFTFDVVGEFSLGGDLGMVEQQKDVDQIIASIHNGFYMMGSLGHVPLQTFWLNNRLTQFIMTHFLPTHFTAFGVFVGWLLTRVDGRMKNGPGDRRRDMMQEFIEMRGLPDEDRASFKDVMVECINILGAGADTTSIAILAVLGRITAHPELVPGLQKEVDGAFEAMRSRDGLDADTAHGDDVERCLPYREVASLPYLSAFIKESMRLHPSIQFQLPRFAPTEGIRIGEHFLPRGTFLGISPRSMNRSKEIFGQDADEFRPERWIPSIERDEDSIKEMGRYLTTFGMGSRTCMGQNIALVEVHKFIGQFVRNFEIDEVVNQARPWKTWTQWFSFQSDFKVRLKARR